MLTDSQISAAIAYLDAPSAPVAAPCATPAEPWRARVVELERKLENARFYLAVACAAAALAYAAWWTGR